MCKGLETYPATRDSRKTSAFGSHAIIHTGTLVTLPTIRACCFITGPPLTTTKSPSWILYSEKGTFSTVLPVLYKTPYTSKSLTNILNLKGLPYASFLNSLKSSITFGSGLRCTTSKVASSLESSRWQWIKFNIWVPLCLCLKIDEYIFISLPKIKPVLSTFRALNWTGPYLLWVTVSIY
jgi:hypothetical protein